MNLTKFGHACLYIEKSGSGLIIDPGNLTEEFSIPSAVEAILLTHSHPDHLDSAKISDILAINPGAKVYGHVSTLQGLRGTVNPARLQAVTAGTQLDIGNFKLEFGGGRHAIIHPDIAEIVNLSLIIDRGEFFYPGDSLEVPSVAVKTLALPASAPWMKISETLDYLAEINPKLAVPVHDAILSDSGRQIVDRLLLAKAKELSIEYRRIDGLQAVEL